MTDWNLFADISDITAWLDESNPTGPHVSAAPLAVVKRYIENQKNA